MDVAAVLTVMGSEGFGRDRVTVTDVEACDKTRASILATSRSSIQSCSSSLIAKDGKGSIDALGSASIDKVTVDEFCRRGNQLSSFNGEDVSKQLCSSGPNGPSWIPRPEEVQVQRRGGKVSRSGSGCSKRQRLAPPEEGIGLAEVGGMTDSGDKLGSCITKCDSQGRSQIAKQRNTSGSKRGDRRNARVSMKAKQESFSVKAGLASFSSAAGGNNFFGLYGLKTEVNDVTTLVEDLSLNDLLDGSYECPSMVKDKGKKAANLTENIVHSVRKACSILQLSRPAQDQGITELNCSNEKMPACPLDNVCTVADGDSVTTDLSSTNKDSRNLAETSPNLLDFSFDKPKDTLERLALPPAKDLESLLLDASKPAASSRHAPDQRPGKQTSRRPSLPAFPWSHTIGGHCRTNSDANKILLGRSTCQGRWVRIGSSVSSLGTASDSFRNLESLTYDATLVPPSGRPKLTIMENNIGIADSVPCEHSSSSAPSAIKSQLFLEESGEDLKFPGKVEYCPMLLGAAQILCDIATDALRPNPDGTMAWPKKLSQKAMKARKSKSKEKSEEMVAASTSLMGSNNMARSSMHQITSSKRAKISTIENKKDLGHINGVRKGPINWSTPKSCRTMPNKSIRHTIEDGRHSTACVVKQSCMPAPPAKVLNRTYSSQPKVRKLMQVEWNRDRDGKD